MDSKVDGANAADIYVKTDKDSTYEYFVTKDGKEISINDIEEGDILFFYAKGKEYHIIVADNTVEGKVRSTSGDKVKIDGTEYKNISEATITAGDEGTYYLNDANKIVMFKKDSGNTGDWAVISKVRKLAATEVGKSYETQVKLALVDGTITDWLDIDEKKNVTETTKYQNYFVKTGDNYVPSFSAGDIVKVNMSSDSVTFPKRELGDLSDRFTGFVTGSISYARTTANKLAYVNDSTVLVKKETVDTDEYKLVVLDLDELGSDTTAEGYFTKLDGNETDLIIFTAIDAKAVKEFAYILKVSEYKDDDKDVKEDREVTVAFQGTNEVETYLAKASEVDEKAGLVEITVEDNKITKVTTSTARKVKAYGLDTKVGDPEPVKEDFYIADKASNGVIKFQYIDSTKALADDEDTDVLTGDFFVANDVLAIKKDGSDLSVSDYGEIGLIHATSESHTVTDEDLDAANEIYEVWTYQESDSDPVEIIAIVYVK